MKKWHMESIVNLTGRQKLALPESSPIQFGSIKLRESEKEFFLVPFFRYCVGLLVRVF